MLDDHDIDKLCHGQIVLAHFYNNSARRNAAGEHFAIMLDSDEEIKANDSYYVVVISHSEESTFRLPVPAYTGLKGFVQGDWVVYLPLPGIIKIGGMKLHGREMGKVLQLVRTARIAKANKSTHS